MQRPQKQSRSDRVNNRKEQTGTGRNVYSSIQYLRMIGKFGNGELHGCTANGDRFLIPLLAMSSLFHTATNTVAKAANALTTPAPMPIFSPELSFFSSAGFSAGTEGAGVEGGLDPILDLSPLPPSVVLFPGDGVAVSGGLVLPLLALLKYLASERKRPLHICRDTYRPPARA